MSTPTDSLAHYALRPFEALCGADVPGQWTTAYEDNVTCQACREMPAFVAMRRARRQWTLPVIISCVEPPTSGWGKVWYDYEKKLIESVGAEPTDPRPDIVVSDPDAPA